MTFFFGLGPNKEYYFAITFPLFTPGDQTKSQPLEPIF